jgi:predicted dehydrogenase
MVVRLTRRGFVRCGAATAASLLAGSAAALEPPLRRVVVAVLGTHGRGVGLIREFLAQPGVAVAYVCDPDLRAMEKGLAAVGSDQQPRPVGVQDFRRALEDPAVDAVVIATPDHWHAPAAIMACAAQKHVYVEKPASHNGHEGELMVQSARKHQRVVQLGTQRRSSPGVQAAIRRLHAGEIGRVLFARGWITSIRPSIGHGREVPPPAELDYALWQGPAPERPYRDNVIHYHWHWFWHWGTGELGNNGIHALDVCRWGMQVDYPRRVVCGGGKYHFDDDQETPDTQLATFDFGDRAIHWEHRTWNRYGLSGDEFGCTFYGEQGTLTLQGPGYRVFDTQGKLVCEEPATTGSLEHVANFLAGIRDGTPLAAEIEEGVKSTALCHLGNIAWRTGRTLNCDPATGHILNDPDASLLWSREYRPGWEPVV